MTALNLSMFNGMANGAMCKIILSHPMLHVAWNSCMGMGVAGTKLTWA